MINTQLPLSRAPQTGFKSDSGISTQDILDKAVQNLRRTNFQTTLNHSPQMAALLALKYFATDALITNPAKEILNKNAAIKHYGIN